MGFMVTSSDHVGSPVYHIGWFLSSVNKPQRDRMGGVKYYHRYKRAVLGLHMDR